jgi:hypothetical protein
MATTQSPARPGGIDTDALRRRYAEERDKRLRPDGNDQYLRLTGDYAHYLDDPHTPRTERAPLTDHRTVVCVGGPDCTPGYYNNEGQDPGSFLGRGYPYGPSAYFSYIDKWRASGTFDGLEFR